MKKHCLALLFVLTLCLTFCTDALAASGETTLTLSYPETLPAVGQTFTVTVDISGNPGVCSLQFAVASDDSVVECTSVKIGKILTGALAANNPKAPKGAMIAAASIAPLEGDGAVGILTYRVLSNGNPRLELAEIRLSDENGKSIPALARINQMPDTVEELEAEAGQEGNGLGDSASPPTSVPSGSSTTGSETQQPDSQNTDQQETEVQAPQLSTGKEDAPEPLFADVPDNYWAAEYIRKSEKMGLFQGYQDGSFRPDRAVTRIQFVTVLWRNAGRPEASADAPFTDLSSVSEEFAQAAAWGYENNIITGYADNTFRPYNTITRQQAVTIIYRISGSEKSSTEQSIASTIYDRQYTDSNQLADYARDAMYWAVFNRYIDPTSSTTLSPQEASSRALLARILVSYLEDSTN